VGNWLEAGAVLRKAYVVDPTLAAQKLAQFASSPILVLPVDAVLAGTALLSAGQLGVDLGDAVLLGELPHVRRTTTMDLFVTFARPYFWWLPHLSASRIIKCHLNCLKTAISSGKFISLST
jgi:hypothetical protein